MSDFVSKKSDPLYVAVADWTTRQGGSRTLAEWAGYAAVDDRSGNSAIPMSEEAQAAVSEEALMRCEDAPFVVELGHFYLRRNQTHEQGVAEAICTRLAAGLEVAPLDDARLDALFDGRSDVDVQPQRKAVSAARGKPLFVLTGGPGTGKTTTVLRMLLQLDDDFRTAQHRPPRIVCCAPTGKASQRLAHALASGGKALLASPSAANWQVGVENILINEAGTVHRFLADLERDARLKADIVVLDEASMLDLAMMHRLLVNLDVKTQVLLVGDANQLTSVETGSAFSDLVQVLRDTHSPALVELVHSFRSVPELQALNEAAGAGELNAFESAIDASKGRVVRSVLKDFNSLKQLLTPWSEQIGSALAQARAFDSRPAESLAGAARVRAVHAALGQRQLLCAVHQGSFGTLKCNDLIEASVRLRAGRDPNEVWYPGRAILISKNDYALGLFNGDVGICLEDPEGDLKVWFLRQTMQDSAEPLGLATHALPAHVPAFAMSIHKSQGSEYPEVAVLLPADNQTEILSRQLLYTAVSRAKNQLMLWASDAALKKALSSNVSRIGALKTRLSSR